MKRSIIVGLACLLQLSAFAQAVVGTWKGDLKVGMSKLSLIFHVSKDTCTLDVPAQGAIGVPASLKELTDTSLTVIMYVIEAGYQGKLRDGQLVGTFTQQGMTFPLTLSRFQEVYNRPQEPKAPYPYKTEEVTISTPEATLAGTLTYPVGCHGHRQRTGEPQRGDLPSQAFPRDRRFLGQKRNRNPALR